MTITHDDNGTKGRFFIGLVMAAVAFARTRQVTILPLCPYARSVFDRDPEIADVLAK